MQNDLSNEPRLHEPGFSGDLQDIWAPAPTPYRASGEADDLNPAQGLLSSIVISSLLWAILALVPVIVRCTII